jgi:hypothetical protein
MTRAEADRLISENEGFRPPSLDLFLDYLGLTEPEFNEIVMKTVVAPHQPDLTTISPAGKTRDFERWYRERQKARTPPTPSPSTATTATSASARGRSGRARASTSSTAGRTRPESGSPS